MVEFSRQSIAFISDYADPSGEIGMEEAGGQNIYVRQMAENLAELGWQVDIFARKSNPNSPTIIPHSPHCRTINLQAGPEAFIARDQLFEYMPAFLKAFQTFQIKQAIRYPLIHTNYWLSAWVGLQLQKADNVQLIHTYHSLGVVKYDTMKFRPAIADIRLGIEQEVLENASCVIATSPQEKETLRESVSESGQIEVIPCGTTANFHSLPKKTARERLGWSEEEKIILYVGRFAPRKGIETLVQACASLKNQGTANFKLVLVGGSNLEQLDGPERKRIELLTQELGLAEQTLFAGRVEHEWLPWYYSAADVCVIPSYYEPFGLVAI
ncbi:MAG: glycosyltransferase, partial [Microcystaceae cyanobacterium]